MENVVFRKHHCGLLPRVLAEQGLDLGTELSRCQISVIPSRQRRELVRSGFKYYLDVSSPTDLYGGWRFEGRYYLSETRFNRFRYSDGSSVGLKQFYCSRQWVERHTKVKSYHCVRALAPHEEHMLFGNVMCGTVVLQVDSSDDDHLV
jgi:hypothetical protein